jgi:hypothetical protein
MAEQARRKIIEKHNWLENGRGILGLYQQRSMQT